MSEGEAVFTSAIDKTGKDEVQYINYCGLKKECRIYELYILHTSPTRG